MSDFRIAKGRTSVQLTLSGDSALSGDMFVQSYSRRGGEAESPADILNDAEPFFPLALEDGNTLMVAKNQVIEALIEHARDEDPELRSAAREAAVEIVLAGGASRTGTLHLEVRSERPRLLDFLNLYDQRFFVLHSSDGVRLINRDLIEHVRPLD